MKTRKVNKKLFGFLQKDIKSYKIKLCSFSSKSQPSTDRQKPVSTCKGRFQEKSLEHPKIKHSKSRRLISQRKYEIKEIPKLPLLNSGQRVLNEINCSQIRSEGLPTQILNRKALINQSIKPQECQDINFLGHRLEQQKQHEDARNINRKQKIRKKTQTLLFSIKQDHDAIQEIVEQQVQCKQAYLLYQRNTFLIIEDQQNLQSQFYLNPPQQTNKNIRALKLNVLKQQINELQQNGASNWFIINDFANLLKKILQDQVLINNDQIYDHTNKVKKKISQLSRVQEMVDQQMDFSEQQEINEIQISSQEPGSQNLQIQTPLQADQAQNKHFISRLTNIKSGRSFQIQKKISRKKTKKCSIKSQKSNSKASSQRIQSKEELSKLKEKSQLRRSSREELFKPKEKLQRKSSREDLFKPKEKSQLKRQKSQRRVQFTVAKRKKYDHNQVALQNNLIERPLLDKKRKSIKQRLTKKVSQACYQQENEVEQPDLFEVKHRQFTEEKQVLLNEFMAFYQQNRDLFNISIDFNQSMDIRQIQTLLKSFFQRHPLHPARQEFESHLSEIRKKKNELIVLDPMREVEPLNPFEHLDSLKFGNIFTPEMLPVYRVSVLGQSQLLIEDDFTQDHCEFHLRK